MFTRPSQPGAIVLGSGPTPVAYVRDVLVAGGSMNRSAPCVFEPGPTAKDLLTYLAALAPGITIPINAEDQHAVVWHGSDALNAEIEGFRQDIRSRYESLLRSMIAEGLLTANEASTLKNPNIDVHVQDLHTVNSSR
jgi:hypothetical protein